MAIMAAQKGKNEAMAPATLYIAFAAPCMRTEDLSMHEGFLCHSQRRYIFGEKRWRMV